MSDESLLAGMAAQNPDAAATFVRRHQARVFGMARAVVGSPAIAEEVAQEAFIRAWRYAGSYDVRKGSAVTWLLTITRNLAIDTLRLRGEQPIDPQLLMGMLTAAERGDQAGVDFEERERLRSALRQLPPDQSKAIVLSVFHGLTAKEIAHTEGVPLGTVKTRIRRGLIKLRYVLGIADG